MASPMMLTRALADGGSVVWDPPERPRLRVAPAWAARLRDEAATCGGARTRRVLPPSDRGHPAPGCPSLPRPAHCPRAARWVLPLVWGTGWPQLALRACLVAVYIALEAVPPSDLEFVEDPAETAWTDRRPTMTGGSSIQFPQESPQEAQLHQMVETTGDA